MATKKRRRDPSPAPERVEVLQGDLTERLDPFDDTTGKGLEADEFLVLKEIGCKADTLHIELDYDAYVFALPTRIHNAYHMGQAELAWSNSNGQTAVLDLFHNVTVFKLCDRDWPVIIWAWAQLHLPPAHAGANPGDLITAKGFELERLTGARSRDRTLKIVTPVEIEDFSTVTGVRYATEEEQTALHEQFYEKKGDIWWPHEKDDVETAYDWFVQLHEAVGKEAKMDLVIGDYERYTEATLMPKEFPDLSRRASKDAVQKAEKLRAALKISAPFLARFAFYEMPNLDGLDPIVSDLTDNDLPWFIGKALGRHRGPDAQLPKPGSKTPKKAKLKAAAKAQQPTPATVKPPVQTPSQKLEQVSLQVADLTAQVASLRAARIADHAAFRAAWDRNADRFGGTLKALHKSDKAWTRSNTCCPRWNTHSQRASR